MWLSIKLNNFEFKVKNRAYGPMVFKTCPTATFAREYFKKV